MNVDSVTHSYTYTSANQTRQDTQGGFEKSNDAVPSRWDTTDTLELSEEYKNRGDRVYGGEPDAKYLAERKQDIEYTAEDLEGIKKRFAAITGRKRDITSKLQKIMESTDSKLMAGDRIKVEISSDGKALVGGIEDAKTAQKLEKAINADKSLIKEIKDFQKEEAAISQELYSITGQSLNDFKTRISDLQMGNVYESVGGQNFSYSIEQRIDLKDQDIYMVDEEFGSMISSYYKDAAAQVGAHSADITGGNNILENADGTVKKAFKDILKNVQLYLDAANEKIRKDYKDDPEEMEKLLLSLEKVTIRADGAGSISIEGHLNEYAATESEGSDQGYKDGIQKIFAETLKANPHTGEKHDFHIASEYLENKYDLAFEGEDPARTLETVYRGQNGGEIESHISSPKEEARLREDIAVEAKDALTDMGIEAESLDIQVDDEGKVIVANMPQGKHEQDMLERALNTLNAATENRSNEEYNNMDKNIGNSIERLKGLLAKLDVFLPGGADILGELDSEDFFVEGKEVRSA